MSVDAVLADREFRPYAMPEGGWLLTQWWRDLLFAHWPVAVEAVQRLLPDGLEVDRFEGEAWVAVVPFAMQGVRVRGLAGIPGTKDFLELNVRTYVRRKGKRGEPAGVYFWSLEASSALAVWGARTFFHLPYQNAEMEMREKNGWIEYGSRRTEPESAAAEFRGRYRSLGEKKEVGELDRWLTERYCLYTSDKRGRLYRGDIHHKRWPLEAADAEIETNSMAKACGVALPERAPHLLFAKEIEVVIWPLRRCD